MSAQLPASEEAEENCQYRAVYEALIAQGVAIRPAVQADLPAICDIYNEVIACGGSTADLQTQTLEQRHQWFNAHTPHERYPIIVLHNSDGSIIGFGSLSRFHERPGFDSVVEVSYYVASSARSHGYGTAMLAWLLEAAALRHYRLIAALIFGYNTSSIALVQRFGFTHFGTFPRSCFTQGDYQDMTYWYKSLVPQADDAAA